jgi:hypothetical protein
MQVPGWWPEREIGRIAARQRALVTRSQSTELGRDRPRNRSRLLGSPFPALPPLAARRSPPSITGRHQPEAILVRIATIANRAAA